MQFGSRSLLRDNWVSERIVRKLRRHETMTEDEIRSLQMAALHRTLVTAISKIRFYRRLPKRFPVAKSVEVLLEFFPLVWKETLLDHPEELYPNAGKPRPWNSIGKTSGTTGTPLSVFRSPESVLM